MIYKIIGDVPQLKNKKSIVFSTEEPQHTLAKLYVDALGHRKLNPVEENVIENNIAQATEYITALKDKTKNNVINKVDGYVKNKQVKGQSLSREDLDEIVGAEMEKAGKHLHLTTMAEATKARNVGAGLDIIDVGVSQGTSDPTVFFVLINDESTCSECKRLHLMEDMKTPRLWKFSEISQDYHKKGDPTPSINGLHPHCRCTLTYLALGFGFDSSGLVKWKAPNFDAYKEQREG